MREKESLVNTCVSKNLWDFFNDQRETSKKLTSREMYE